MKIGLVSPYPFQLPGGVNEHIKGLYRFLKSKGHDVRVIAPRHDNKENYGKDFLLFGKDIPFPFNASTSYASFELDMNKLKKMLEREKFDILHFHDIGVFLPLQILNLSKSKNILTFHSLPDGSLIYRVSSDILKWAEKPVSDNFSSLIATSKPVRKIVKKIYKGPTYIIPNAIDSEKFNPKVNRIKKFVDDKINILFVGRFDKRKGLDYLLNAFLNLKKTNSNIRLIVVGSGDNKDYYQKFVNENKIDDVVFEGYVKDEDLPKYYATCDIFCSPALYGEGFGIVLLEAMASKKPVAGFANSGYKHVMHGIGRKFLVKPEDTEGLTKVLQNLVENKKLRERLGKWGLKQVEKYSWEKVGNEILKVYEMVLNGK